jgi:hypothetical protein
MDILLPKTLIATDVVSNNLVDTAIATYVETSTYVEDDEVVVDTTIFPKRIYKALGAVATYTYPPDNPTDWLDTGCPNKWKMFDEYLTTQSVADGTETPADTIVFELKSGLQSSIALFGLKGSLVKFEFKDSGGTIQTEYTQEKTLLDEKVTDWWLWFFDQFMYMEEVIFDFPSWQVSSVVITITSTLSGIAPACGYCILGERFHVGYTQYDIKTSIIDYSTKSTNAFGDTYLKQGNYVKLMDLDIIVDSYMYDVINRALISVRGKPTIFEGNNVEFDTDYSSFKILGFIKDFDQILTSRDLMRCSMSIQGLT